MLLPHLARCLRVGSRTVREQQEADDETYFTESRACGRGARRGTFRLRRNGASGRRGGTRGGRGNNGPAAGTLRSRRRPPAAGVFLGRRRLVLGRWPLRLASGSLGGSAPGLSLGRARVASGQWLLAHGAGPLGSRLS